MEVRLSYVGLRIRTLKMDLGRALSAYRRKILSTTSRNHGINLRCLTAYDSQKIAC